MALPVTIPNTFASATTSIPLSQLDTNFSTLANAINGINSGAETLANLKASNVTITGGIISNVTLDNVTVDVETLSNVTINGGNVTVTNMVASTANANTINVTTINARDGTASISLANSTGVLSLSNAIVATAGTSAAPAITTSGDTNTGIFFPAADTIAFAEGGVEAMRINSTSGVSIGTTTDAGAGALLVAKGIVQRVSSTASITSPLAWNSDNFDLYEATAQAGNFTINADAGTPTDARKIIFRLTSDATPGRVVTFTGGSSKGFKPIGTNLSISGANFTYTLTASKTTYFGAIYDTTVARWEVVALSQES